MSSIAIPLRATSDRAIPVPFRLGYRPWLDGLRGVAILLVLASHTEPMLLPRGFLGVDLFFVISGFLITSLLLEEWDTHQTISFRSFYARRVLRLFPALFVMLIVSAFVMYLFPGVGQQYRSILYSLFYISNYVLAFDLDQVSSTLTITWSLAVEEQFYLLWPITLFAALRYKLKPSTIVLLLLGIIAAICIHRSMLVSEGATVLRTRYAFDTRADSILSGCVVAVLARYGLMQWSDKVVKLVTAGLAVLFALYLLGFGDPESVGFSLIALCFAGVLIILISNPPKFLVSALSTRSLVWIGRISYSLYLWHLYAFFAVEISGIDRKYWSVTAIPLAFVFASLSYYFIERPFLKLKKRYAVVSSA